LVRRSNIGIARRRFGARGWGGVALDQWSRRKEEEKRENGVHLNIDISGLPMQLRCTGGSVLIMAVRISLGCEEDKMVGGCPNDVTTDPSGFLSRMFC
jgi:hypothetical protein